MSRKSSKNKIMKKPKIWQNVKDFLQVKNVRRFGAAGDGVTKDTDAIAAAVSACAKAGGGTVYFYRVWEGASKWSEFIRKTSNKFRNISAKIRIFSDILVLRPLTNSLKTLLKTQANIGARVTRDLA